MVPKARSTAHLEGPISEHRFYFKAITKVCKYVLTRCFKDMVQTIETICATYVMFIVPLQLAYGEYNTQTTLSLLWTLNYCVDFVQVITAFYRLRQHLPANARDLIDWQHGQNQSRRPSGSVELWLRIRRLHPTATHLRKAAF